MTGNSARCAVGCYSNALCLSGLVGGTPHACHQLGHIRADRVTVTSLAPEPPLSLQLRTVGSQHLPLLHFHLSTVSFCATCTVASLGGGLSAGLCYQDARKPLRLLHDMIPRIRLHSHTNFFVPSHLPPVRSTQTPIAMTCQAPPRPQSSVTVPVGDDASKERVLSPILTST